MPGFAPPAVWLLHENITLVPLTLHKVNAPPEEPESTIELSGEMATASLFVDSQVNWN